MRSSWCFATLIVPSTVECHRETIADERAKKGISAAV
jgi:hypothetical protein